MKWQIKEKAPKEFIKQYPEYSPLVLQLLYDRNLKTQKEIDEFFNSDYESDLHDPFLMKGVKKAVKEIKKAIASKKKILIYGDYDADGICSTVILQETLEKLGAQDVDFHIPDRSREGYGLNEEAVKRFAKDGIGLMITVDCGVVEVDNIKLAKSLGIDTIVVDHHQCADKIPEALVIIDPHQEGETYPFKDLAAVGVVFKLIQALVKGEGLEPGYTKWLLDLVALATVADVVPLLGENRTLVKYGLVVLAQTQRVGLKKLMEVARITDYTLHVFVAGNGQKEHRVDGLDSWTFAFALAPRINVAARMGSVDAAYHLLVTQSESEAEEIAQTLEKLNRKRQQMVRDIIKEVEERLTDKPLPKIIVEGGDKWTTGIIGLIAGRIKDKYHRPVFICNLEDDEVRCSSRSIKGFDVVKAMKKCSDLLIQSGGHPMAAGLALKKEDLEKFKEKINKVADKQLKEKDLTPSLDIDMELPMANIDWKNYDLIQKFAPFGKDNPSPVFIAKDLEVLNIKVLGNGAKHLRLELFGPAGLNSSAMKKIKSIGFGLGERGGEIKVGDSLDVVFEMIIDQWNGNRNLQLKLLDFKKHE